MKTNDYPYFIERYISGEMNDTEKIWFEKELDGNANLRREVELRKKTDELLKRQDIISLRNKLTAIETAREEKIHRRLPQTRLYLRFAAAITIMVIVGSVILLEERNLSTMQIMKRYYTEYQPVAGERSAQTESDINFTRGLECFETHDFKNAALFFNKVIENEPKDMYATLLTGISHFEDNSYNDAKKSFGIVIDDNKNLYIDQAQWYLVWCYLQTGENEKAIQLLQIIGNEGGLFSKTSKKILKKIKK
jgi:tetratricopeptide (TPR) repeat protein